MKSLLMGVLIVKKAGANVKFSRELEDRAIEAL